MSFEHYYPPLDAWFDVRATPTEDGLSVYFHDITDRLRAERSASREEATRDRPAADPQRGRRAPGGHAGARRAAAILSDVVLNGFGEGVIVRAREQIVAARRREPTGGGGSGSTTSRAPRRAGGCRCGRALRRRASAAPSAPAPRPRRPPALAVPLVSRGRMLGAILVLDPTPARSTGAC